MQKSPVILSIPLTEATPYTLHWLTLPPVLIADSKKTYFNRALVQKRPVILSILLTEATPYKLHWLTLPPVLIVITIKVGLFCKRVL